MTRDAAAGGFNFGDRSVRPLCLCTHRQQHMSIGRLFLRACATDGVATQSRVGTGDLPLFAVGNPDVLHLVSTFEVKKSFTLSRIEEIDLATLVCPHLL